MNIKIGEKIRQLRQRDGRKQEDLANALGVSCQAVSRWEANGGYPDMELIPTIANYFNVSIDELFGYSKDREEKLRSILEKADSFLNWQGDMTECVEMLRHAAEEFPSEPRILIKLGYALSIHGWRKYGAKSYTVDGSDYAHEDTEYNSGNVYWQEEITVFEKVLGMDIPSEDRDIITMMLVTVYAKMGYNDKAKTLAEKQNSLRVSRELLMGKATEAEERDKYYGEAIIELLTELKTVICYSVGTKVSLFTSPNGVKLYLDLAHLYESIFGEENCGYAHFHIRDLYLNAAVSTARHVKDPETAFEYFKKAFAHHKKYTSMHCTGEYRYTAPLLEKVTFPSENFPVIPDYFWKSHLSVFTDELISLIRSDPTFDECFES
ncbi:MAG: helix-turn-helix transcriptional regulator [Clostridia bacterium]|nr:helix-turn-helix transcriptional regulator [Clostridia bacterium]